MADSVPHYSRHATHTVAGPAYFTARGRQQQGGGDEENMQCECVKGEKGLQGWRRRGVKREREGCAGKEVVGCRKTGEWTKNR